MTQKVAYPPRPQWGGGRAVSCARLLVPEVDPGGGVALLTAVATVAVPGGVMILRISHIGVHETYSLLSNTSSQIAYKEKHEQVKEILFNRSVMNLNTLLFKPVKTKIVHNMFIRTYK